MSQWRVVNDAADILAGAGRHLIDLGSEISGRRFPRAASRECRIGKMSRLGDLSSGDIHRSEAGLENLPV